MRTCVAPLTSRGCSRRPGTIALVSLVSPYSSDREAAAALHAAERSALHRGVRRARRWRSAKQRDPKGLYARARAGELQGFTGVGAPYETPAQPDLVLHTCAESVEAEVERVLGALAALAT